MVTLVTHGHIGHIGHMVTLFTHVHIRHTWSHRVKVQPNLNYETNVYQKVSSLTDDDEKKMRQGALVDLLSRR